MVLSRGKRWILTPRGAKTPELISVKLEVYDYVRDPTPHDKIAGGNSTWVVCANSQFVMTFGFCPYFFNSSASMTLSDY